MLSTVAAVCERLVKEWDPDSVIRFGSRAHGAENPSSDVDLLVVKETDERPIDRRAAAERILGDRSIPVDLLVYTPQETLAVVRETETRGQQAVPTSAIETRERPAQARTPSFIGWP